MDGTSNCDADSGGRKSLAGGPRRMELKKGYTIFLLYSEGGLGAGVDSSKKKRRRLLAAQCVCEAAVSACLFQFPVCRLYVRVNFGSVNTAGVTRE